MRGLGVAVVVCLAVVLLLVPPASALDLREWVPGLTVSPFLSERVEYDSNVFQTPSHARGDVLFKTIPGLLADYNFGPHSLSVGYRAELLRYVDLTQEDATHHFAVGQLRLEFSRLLFNLRDDFAHTTDPPGTELTGRIRSDTNVLAPEAEYGLTQRFSVGTNYSWTHVHFDPSVAELDRDEHLIGGSVFWKFLPKSDLRLNYSYGEKDFTTVPDRDVTRHVVTLGLRGDLTAKLSSTFRLGFEDRIPRAANGTGYTGLIGGGDWVYKPTERTTITLTTDRSVQESTFQTEPFYVSTSGTLSAQQQLLPKLNVSVKATGGVNDYPLKETQDGQTDWRRDVFYAFSGGLEYLIQRWLVVGLEYTYTARRSNFNSFSFIEDRVVGKVTLQF